MQVNHAPIKQNIYEKLLAAKQACLEELALLEYKENVRELYLEGKKEIEIYHGLLLVIDINISLKTFKAYYKEDFKEIDPKKREKVLTK